MNRILLILIFFIAACGSQFNKGVIAKKELRKKKPPSLQIAEEYDKRAEKNTKTYNNPKRAAKARENQSAKQKKKGDKYLKKKQKKLK